MRAATVPSVNLWSGARELFCELREFEGTGAYDELIVPWLADDRDSYRTQLEPLTAGGRSLKEPGASFDYWLAIPYALSRVSDVLLLGFQPDLDPGVEMPWAHELHLNGTVWPTVTREEYLDLFTALGMTPVTDTEFDPFLHEIVEVEQAEDPDAPISVTDLVWPGLMLGEMMFSRAGVRVRAGVNHAQRGVADRSPLYGVFLRRHRATVDASLGWGFNSQWDTDFRRDYRTADAVYLNVDSTEAIDEDNPENAWPVLLTRTERRELVRHRCLLRTPDAVEAMARRDPHWPANIWPYEWPLTIPTSTAG